MSNVVITAENLGKRYTIGHQRGRGDQTTFREVLVQNARNLWNKSRDLIAGKPVIAGDTLEEVWALKDVSFEIKRGEAVGIIGRNGAGKSTLLKILSRITEPTTGRVTIKGRVASLLEVGTGFHSELTGRENIYLNGTILGMTRAEIKRKFDEIVAFSEVERYLDTPVKRYSSGMYVRLAFSVAAHLDPEILIVDEVLAVGDTAFQKKCMGKMGSFSREGLTVLFVSHNMMAIKSLCRKTLWLVDGYPFKIGSTDEIITNYLRDTITLEDNHLPSLVSKLPPDPAIRIVDFRIAQNNRITIDLLTSEETLIEIEYEVLQATWGLRIYFDLCDVYQDIIIRSFHDENEDEVQKMMPGIYKSTAIIPANMLSPRNYEIIIRATIHNIRTCTGDGIHLIVNVKENRRINLGYPDQKTPAKIRPTIHWRMENILK